MNKTNRDFVPKAERIKTIDNFFLFFVILLGLFSLGILAYNELYIHSSDLFNQYAILFLIDLLGYYLWKKNKI